MTQIGIISHVLLVKGSEFFYVTTFAGVGVVDAKPAIYQIEPFWSKSVLQRHVYSTHLVWMPLVQHALGSTVNKNKNALFIQGKRRNSKL